MYYCLCYGTNKRDNKQNTFVIFLVQTDMFCIKWMTWYYFFPQIIRKLKSNIVEKKEKFGIINESTPQVTFTHNMMIVLCFWGFFLNYFYVIQILFGLCQGHRFHKLLKSFNELYNCCKDFNKAVVLIEEWNYSD